MSLTVRSFQQYGFTITLLFLGWFVSSMDRMFINIAIVPIGEELHMDAASLGIVLSIFYLGYTLMQISLPRSGGETRISLWGSSALSSRSWVSSYLMNVRKINLLDAGSTPPFLTPAIMGALIQAFHGSYEIAFAYLIVGNLVSLVMGLFLGKTKKLFAATPYS